MATRNNIYRERAGIGLWSVAAGWSSGQDKLIIYIYVYAYVVMSTYAFICTEQPLEDAGLAVLSGDTCTNLALAL